MQPGGLASRRAAVTRQRCQTAGGRIPSYRVAAQAGARAMFRLQRARNDIIDAALIAACTAAVETCQAPRIRASRRSPSTSLLSSKSRRIARADPPRRISNSRTRGRDRSGNLASQKAPRRRTTQRRRFKRSRRAGPFHYAHSSGNRIRPNSLQMSLADVVIRPIDRAS
jgi:hypothetical protein